MEIKERVVKQGRFAQWETLWRLLYDPVRFEAVIYKGQVLCVMWLKRKHGFFRTILDRFSLAKVFGSFYFKSLPKEAVLITLFSQVSAAMALREEIRKRQCGFVSRWPIDVGYEWNLSVTLSPWAWRELQRLHPKVTENLELARLLVNTLSFEVLLGWSPEEE